MTVLEYLLFYIIILIPNLFRQFNYFSTYSRTGTYIFISSYETRNFFKKKSQLLGIIEEMFLGLTFTLFWFYLPILKFLAYGWLVDALMDSVITSYWIMKEKLLYGFIKNPGFMFFFRELLVPYLIAGPLLFILKADLLMFSALVFFIQVVFYTISKT